VRVLVTGVARELGAEVARRLDAEASVEELAGLDIERPVGRFRRLRFHRLDLRQTGAVARVRALEVDVVVHCAIATAGSAPRAAHEQNVIGTVNLLAGLAGSRLHKLVVRSAGDVYATGPALPTVLREADAARRRPSTPLGRDLHEVEAMVDDFATANPATVVSVLRLGPILGQRWRSRLAEHLAAPAPAIVGGFDPNLQLLAEDDAAEAILLSVTADHPGTFNVAGDGVLLLSELLRLAGRRERTLLPPLGAPWLIRQAAQALTGRDLPDDTLRLIQHGLVLDCGRLLHEFGWRPPTPTREVAAAHGESLRPALVAL
jgi:UDP-glucose 4-epimerase